MESRKPEAKACGRWATAEVLPTIRKTGGADGAPDSQAGLALSNPDTALDALERAIAIARDQRETIAELSPKAEAHDELMGAGGAVTIDEAARALGTGRNRLYATLRDKGYLKRFNSEPHGREIHEGYLPYQQFEDRGYFATKAATFTDPFTGVVKVTHKTLVTSKGLTRLRTKLKA